MKKKILLLAIVTLFSNLLLAKAKISEQDIIKAIKGGVESTKQLLRVVPIDYMSPNDDTLLHYAVRFRKPRVVEYLVEQKIPLSRKGGPFYGTALQEAIYYGHLGIASYLIEMGTYLNIKNKYGDTALHLAAKGGYLDIVEELLAHGASKKITNNEGKTPYDVIADLSWDSKKKLQELLKVEEPKNSKGVKSKSLNHLLYYINGHARVERRKNETINIIDKKSKIDNSNFGIEIDIQK